MISFKELVDDYIFGKKVLKGASIAIGAYILINAVIFVIFKDAIVSAVQTVPMDYRILLGTFYFFTMLSIGSHLYLLGRGVKFSPRMLLPYVTPTVIAIIMFVKYGPKPDFIRQFPYGVEVYLTISASVFMTIFLLFNITIGIWRSELMEKKKGYKPW